MNKLFHKRIPRERTINAAKVRLMKIGIRTTLASGDSTCPYCGDAICEETFISGTYGVRWGHTDCVERASSANRLVRTPTNNSHDEMDFQIWSRCLSAGQSNEVLTAIGAKTMNSTKSEEHLVLSTSESRARLEITAEKNAGEAPTSAEEVARRREKLSCFGDKYLDSDLGCGSCLHKADCYISTTLHRGGRPLSTTCKHLQGSVRKMVKGSGIPSSWFISRWVGTSHSPRWDHIIPKNPEVLCQHFTPKALVSFSLPEDMRPGAGHGEAEFQKPILEQLWERLGNQKFREWKMLQTSLPRCDFHEGRWGLKGGSTVHVSLTTKLVESKKEGTRILLLSCPGTPIGWDGTPPIRG